MRYRTAIVAGTLALASGVTVLVRFQPSTSADETRESRRGSNGPATAAGADSPILTEEQAVALLSGEQRQIVENATDPSYRRVLLFGLAQRDALTGDPMQLEVFQEALREYQRPDAADPKAWEALQIVPFCMAFTARAWVQAGPYPTLEEECIEHAIEFGSESDDLFRLQAAALLEVIRRYRPNQELPADAAAVLHTLRQNDWIETELRRQLQVLRDAASTAGRTLPE